MEEIDSRMDIILKGITKNYRNQEVLNGVNINIKKGSFHCIVGDSGNGKTTILKIISGLVNPDSGVVMIGGKDMTGVKPQKRDIGYVMQNPLLFPHLTIEKNIAFGLEARKYPRDEIAGRVLELLSLLKIEEIKDKMPSGISGGQSQRVSIARALAGNTKVLLMDEPFSSLDPKLREEMGNMIKNIQNEIGVTILFVTHDINEALRLSDDISLLQEGKIAQSGPKNEIYEKPLNKQVADFFGISNWIDGIVENGIFYCDIGSFAAKGLNDGNASGFIRPYAVQITPDEGDFAGEIIKIENNGKETGIDVKINNIIVKSEILGKSENKKGDKVRVKFVEELWIILKV